MTNTINI